MSLKESVKRIFRIRKAVKEEKYDKVPTNLQIIVMEDDLIVTLGQWMGMFPACTKTVSNDVTIVEHLDAKDFLKKHKVTTAERDEVENRFALMLDSVGYKMEDVCVLDDFNAETLTFKGFFLSTEQAEFSIRFGEFLAEPRNIRINYNDTCSIYNYKPQKGDDEDTLKLENSTKELDNNKKFHRYFSNYGYFSEVYDKDKKIKIDIKYPSLVDETEIDSNDYVNTTKMEKIISGISFQDDIQSICAKISEGLSMDVETYPVITVAIIKNVDNKMVTTDEAIFKNGKFEKLVITKNGKKISIDEFDNWSYDSDTHTINYVNDTKINYSFKGNSANQISDLESPEKVIKSATEDVEEVKGMTLTLFKKESKSN